MIRYVIIDDHKMLRQGLRRILDDEDGFEFTGEAADGLEGLKLIQEARPDVALVDIMMPGIDGIELTRRARDLAPGTKIIIISMLDNRSYVEESSRAGARGYVVKGSGGEELVSAIKTVEAGGQFVRPSISRP
ncbi:MAG: response regulator transcription factor [Dehalococcoidia bacterium]|nr:response regulator transcription factor [Dehalococcoidia bacterium]